MNMRFLGATTEVTGSRNLIELEDIDVLVDFGLKQGNLRNLTQTMRENGREFEFDVEDIGCVIITHAHADHLNNIPLLIKRGYRNKILMTQATLDFARITLYDSAKIMLSDVEWYNNTYRKELEPIYTKEDVDKTLDYIEVVDFNQVVRLSENVSFEMLRAGHMLGAGMPKFYTKNEVVVYTGDTSAFTHQKPFLTPADRLGDDVSIVVCESTYGDRRHERIDIRGVLKDSIEKVCVQQGGTLLIPVFAMQRSSEIIWELREVYLENNFYDIPIYLDTPMGIDSQSVVKRNDNFWGDKWLERNKLLGDIFDWDVLQYVHSHELSMALNNNNPKVILSSSGMCNAGRVLNHLENFLPHKENKILLCGYQAEDTIGHHLLQRSCGGAISINGNRVDVRAEVDFVSFSSHADYNQMTSLIKSTNKSKLKKVYLVHGDKKAKQHFQKHLKRHLSNVSVEIAEYNKVYTH